MPDCLTCHHCRSHLDVLDAGDVVNVTYPDQLKDLIGLQVHVTGHQDWGVWLGREDPGHNVADLFPASHHSYLLTVYTYCPFMYVYSSVVKIISTIN